MLREIEKSMVLKEDVRVKEILHFGSLNNVMMIVFGFQRRKICVIKSFNDTLFASLKPLSRKAL